MQYFITEGLRNCGVPEAVTTAKWIALSWLNQSMFLYMRQSSMDRSVALLGNDNLHLLGTGLNWAVGAKFPRVDDKLFEYAKALRERPAFQAAFAR